MGWTFLFSWGSALSQGSSDLLTIQAWLKTLLSLRFLTAGWCWTLWQGTQNPVNDLLWLNLSPGGVTCTTYLAQLFKLYKVLFICHWIICHTAMNACVPASSRLLLNTFFTSMRSHKYDISCETKDNIKRRRRKLLMGNNSEIWPGLHCMWLQTYVKWNLEREPLSQRDCHYSK